MKITYRTRKLERICTDVRTAEKAHGREMAEIIDQRIGEIRAADSVEMLMKFHI